MSGMDINDPNFGAVNFSEDDSSSEGHQETDNQYKSMVKDAEHPLFSSSGLLDLVNQHRNLSNSSEKELTGEIKKELFNNVAKAVRQTRVPYDLLMFCLDWKKDLTGSDGSEAVETAKKLLNYIPELRQTLGRDPMNAEVFMAFVLKSASKVKQIIDNAEKKPDEEVKQAGSDKDNILMNKKRNGKDKKRTNLELYDYFYRRIPNGKVTFKQFLGKEPKQ